ncbi:Alpha-ketoglutaric semialdehyde dehydrogenase [Nocardioides aquaticus]|uniref:Alpha-ketoglutaric semialdehyde dehydrogenase n=1 Tax=Nocardioides aquaticus TaxID=160826 RepID=A0ABX8EML4_9ACTN|nr:aldehyde dehydrogenase (NADP(+)) [Nocardioides aquaticus]QVT81763.1 Alpha-ketoglutaric semialdehyde dehydrogenase [Nocardioides aquaticus]
MTSADSTPSTPSTPAVPTSVRGVSVVAGEELTGTAGTLRARAAATGAEIGPEFGLLDLDQLDRAVAAAADAAATYRATTPAERSALLTAMAEEIEADRDDLVACAVAESGLPEGRIAGEVGRTTGQLRLFAGVAASGDHLGVRLDPALPERTPLPRADLRQRWVPLGPVAVFGASNFPLAFSTAGGDTASALAAGCPVVVKGHPAHPGTGELVARAVARAVARVGLPAGTFSFVLGAGNEFGAALVADPRIKAVGFTGSRAGGLALVDVARARREPIPVYAEMSSVNPVVVLPGALARQDPAALAQAFVGSLTLGSGQFCTNPGLALVPAGEAGDAFVAEAGRRIADATGQRMLTPGIAEAYARGVADLAGADGVEQVATGSEGGEGAPAPALSVADWQRAAHAAEQEVFGASGVVVRWSDLDELLTILRGVEGQLTATVHCDVEDAQDAAQARALLPVLEDRAGRILFNGWPTGVEVGHAMVHGGPFPATSDSRTTSVGSLAVERFQRPVCYQDVPAGLLPAAVADDNPWGLTRRVDGVLELGGRA